MLQWSTLAVVGLGISIDLRRCKTPLGQPFGPVVDVFLGNAILSFGVRPVYSHGDLFQTGYSRGGVCGGCGEKHPLTIVVNAP